MPSLRRQFEFIQQSWLNNTKFNGLYDEKDPLSSAHRGRRNDDDTGETCARAPAWTSSLRHRARRRLLLPALDSSAQIPRANSVRPGGEARTSMWGKPEDLLLAVSTTPTLAMTDARTPNGHRGRSVGPIPNVRSAGFVLRTVIEARRVNGLTSGSGGSYMVKTRS